MLSALEPDGTLNTFSGNPKDDSWITETKSKDGTMTTTNRNRDGTFTVTDTGKDGIAITNKPDGCYRRRD